MQEFSWYVLNMVVVKGSAHFRASESTCLKNTVNVLRGKVTHPLNLFLSDVLKGRVNDYFEGLKNPVVNFNTETKWKKYYIEKLGVVEPVEIALGVRFDSRRNRSSGTYNQVPVTDKLKKVL